MRSELSEDAKKARNAYRRAWAKKNPDKIRTYTMRYWEKKAERNSEDEKKCE